MGRTASYDDSSNRRARIFLVLTLALLLSACTETGDGATSTAGAPARADSSGVPVVLNAADPPGATWRISDEPTLSIGTANGASEDLLFRAYNGFVLSDGRIAVANTGTLELRLYDADGRHVSSVGGEGDGPGEFRRLALSAPFAGDSLIAFDSRLRRVTVLAPDGTIARSHTLPDQVFGDTGIGASLIGVIEGGHPVLRVSEARTDESGIVRDPSTVGILSADGTRWTALGVFPGSERSAVRSETASVGTSVPYGRGLQETAGGRRIVVGNDDAFSLRVYDGGGRLLRLVRQDRPPRPAGPEYFEQFMETQLERLPTRPAEIRGHWETAIEQIPRYETLPAFGQIRLDRLGYLWVQEYTQVGEPRADWQVFDPQGVLTARVRLPERLAQQIGRFEILDIGEDYLLGREVDELGVERVRAYELTRAGAG